MRKNEDKCKPLQPLEQQPQTITQPLGKYMPATLHKFCFFAPCHFWTTSCDQQRIGIHQFIPICLNHIESTFVMFKRLNHATSNMFMVKSNMFMVRHVHGSIIHFFLGDKPTTRPSGLLFGVALVGTKAWCVTTSAPRFFSFTPVDHLAEVFSWHNQR